MAELHPWRTRSALRRTGQGHKVDPRRFWLRWAIVLGTTATVYWLVQAVRTKAINSDGPFRFLYLLHDHVYLWLKGTLWTQYFPTSLLWAVPLVSLGFLVLVEILTPIGTRGIQRYFLRRLVDRPMLHWVFPRRIGRPRFDIQAWRALDRDPSKVPSRLGGFALRVVQERSLEDWHDLRDAAQRDEAQFSKETTTRIVRLQKLALGLAPEHPKTVLATLEVLALLPASRAGSVLEKALNRLCPISGTSPTEVTEIEAAAERISVFTAPQTSRLCREARDHLKQQVQRLSESMSGRAPALYPVSLASMAVQVATIAHACSLPEGRLFFETWAEARRTDTAGDFTANLGMAETLIDFPFWARRAERSGGRAFPEGLLALALGDLRQLHGYPEDFAFDGEGR